MPGASVFYKDANGEVFHTYSTYARGLDMLVGAYNFLDLTPKGRDEEELPWSMAWVRHHDRVRRSRKAPAANRSTRRVRPDVGQPERRVHDDRRAKDQPLPVVRHRGRGRREILCAVFKNSQIGRVSRYANAGQEIHGKPAGSVMAVEFELEGQRFAALNGGPQFKFDEAISFQVHCQDQSEIDYYWSKLTAGGKGAPAAG